MALDGKLTLPINPSDLTCNEKQTLLDVCSRRYWVLQRPLHRPILASFASTNTTRNCFRQFLGSDRIKELNSYNVVLWWKRLVKKYEILWNWITQCFLAICGRLGRKDEQELKHAFVWEDCMDIQTVKHTRWRRILESQRGDGMTSFKLRIWEEFSFVLR